LAASFNQKIQSHSVYPFHGKKCFLGVGVAPFIGFHNVWVFERETDFAFGRFFPSDESGLKFGRLFLIEDFQADHSAYRSIISTPNSGHASLAAPSLEVEPAL